MAMATAALSRREVNRIILTRPAVEAGERLGFLPGDLMAKVDPYLRPLFDALHDMMDAERVAAHLERGVIEVAPLAFMRGRTLNDSFVILDEAQNTSPEQMKMFLTRLGFGSRMVVTGDITQIDLPREQRSGLVVVGEILDGVDGVEFVRFGGEDVVRHKLVQRIVAAYDEHSARQAPELRPGRPSPPARRERARGGRARRRSARRAVRRACVLAAATGGRRGRPRRRQLRRRPEEIAALNAEHRGKAGPTDVLSFPVDGAADVVAGARELGDVVICPAHTEDLDRGRRPRRAAPRGHGPRDRRGRDAGAAGGARRRGCADPLGLRRARRPAQRRQVDAGQRDGRAQGRDRVRQAADDAARDPRRGDASDDVQMVLTDLPGVQRPRDELTRRMQRRVEQELGEADAALFVVNADQGVGGGGDRWIAEALGPRRRAGRASRSTRSTGRPTRARSSRSQAAADLVPGAEVFPVSARTGARRARRSSTTWPRCSPEGPFYFPPEEVSDQPESVLLAELVREQVLARTRQEVPHAVEVQVEEIEHRGDWSRSARCCGSRRSPRRGS